MKKGIKKSTVVILVALLFIILSGLNVVAKEVKLGFSGPLTGGAAPWGLSHLNAIKFYVDEINQSGGMNIAGEKVTFKVIAYDDKWTASEGVSNVTKLIHSDNVDFLFITAGPIAMATKDIVEENK